MHMKCSTPRSIPELTRLERWAAVVAAERASQRDELASLPDHALAAVASVGDGHVRHLALAVWHARRQTAKEVA